MSVCVGVYVSMRELTKKCKKYFNFFSITWKKIHYIDTIGLVVLFSHFNFHSFSFIDFHIFYCIFIIFFIFIWFSRCFFSKYFF